MRVVKDTSIPVRLSEDLRPGGALKPSAIMRGLMTLEQLVEEFDLRQKPFRAVGTAVLRMTSNPEAFTVPARDILGVDVELISGEQEAVLMGRGAVLGLGEIGPRVTVDVGGQSTEVCWCGADDRWHPLSLSMGVVGLTSRFVSADPPAADEVANLRAEARRVIFHSVPDNLEGRLVGVAGTATTLGILELKLNQWKREAVHGLEMRREKVGEWLDRMLAISAEQRTNQYGVRKGRADVFPAGICILDELLRHLGQDSFVISANGLRVGVALELLEGKR